MLAYFSLGVIFIAFKLWFSAAAHHSLFFLLKPVDSVVGFFLASPSRYSPDTGFFHADLNILIDKSCCGFNFWILCFLMLSVCAFRHWKQPARRILVLPAALLGAYGITLCANASRILLALFIDSARAFPASLRPHLAVGAFVYLFYLVAAYMACDYVLGRRRPA
jgi:exosortase K